MFYFMSFSFSLFCPSLRLFHLKGVYVSLLYAAVMELACFEKGFQRKACRFLRGAVLTYGLVCAAVALGKVHYGLPLLGRGDTYEARAVHLLVRPEGIAYVVLFHHTAEIGLPLIAVVPYLAHIHRQVRLVAKVDVRLYCFLGSLAPVAVARINDFVVESPVGQRFEITVPLWGPEYNDVFAVYLAYCSHAFFVHSLEF